MIIVKLQGGLGNQMFQYATAYAISRCKGLVLKIDLSFFRNSPNRHFALNNFLISSEIIYCPPLLFDKAIRKIVPAKFRNGLDFIPPYNKLIIKEQTLEYDPYLFELGDNIYLEGYWQSEKYFTTCRDDILKEFSFLHPLYGINEKIASNIKNENSVSLHVRRGDYVSHKSNSEIYSQCTSVYYQSAVNFIADRVAEPVFYIFSDEPEWVEQNINIGFNSVFVKHNQMNESEDLRLMSLCKHNIIANSTFSWWGAWLNQNPEKIVIAPEKWFVNDIKTDIIPPQWICI